MSDLLTVDDLAGMLSIGRDWIYAEVRAGRIPHVRLGRYVRFRRDAIEEWLLTAERGRIAAPTKRPRVAGTTGGMAHEENAS